MLGSIRAGALGLVMSGLMTTAAQADWRQATSRHFVVYSNGTEEDLRRQVTDLEHLDGVMRYLHRLPDTPETASNKLTIFVVPDVTAVQRLCGNCPNVYGFYTPRASGSVVFTPRRAGNGEKLDLGPRQVLFHEYGHHFLLGNYANAYPQWYSEGFAEFISTMQVVDKGYRVGAPAMHRAMGLVMGETLPATVLFDPASRPRLTAAQIESVYGRGWLLVHYLMFDAARQTQFKTYLTLLNSGTPSREAAVTAFGDLKALDKALDRYRDARTMNVVTIMSHAVPDSTVEIRALTPGERALIEMRMVSTRGVNGTTAGPLFARAAKAAAPYPQDVVAQGWLAEMAADAGEDAQAEAAADRALAVDPNAVQALLYKANIRFRAAAKATKDGAKADGAKAWDAARAIVIRANRLDPNRAQPLLDFYQSFGWQGATPTKSAIRALYRAQELVPQDPSVRFQAATQHLSDGEVAEARLLLRPLAYDPHAGPDNGAATLLAKLDALGDRKIGPAEVAALLAAPTGKATAADK